MATSLIVELNGIADKIAYYDNILYLAFGIPLNLVNILVFSRLMLSKTNKTNMGFLGLCQSIIDILTLINVSLVLRSNAFFEVKFSNQSDSLCKFINYIRRFLSTSSSWMEVITTFDRFIFVIFGHGGRFKFMEKKRYLALILACVALFLAAAHISNLFYYKSNDNCIVDSGILVASDMILICLRSYVPLFLMIFFDIFMIRFVIKKKRAVMNQSSKSTKEHIFTLSVIANNGFYLILYIPFTIYFIIYDINLYSFINNNVLFKAYFNVYGNIAKDLSFYAQTLTFFVYLIFNKLYRNEILDLLGKVISIKRNGVNGDPNLNNPL